MCWYIVAALGAFAVIVVGLLAWIMYCIKREESLSIERDRKRLDR